MNSIVEATKLQRLFGTHKAVDELTFHVKQGEVFGLLGPNGAGKTTTVRLLNGILPPSSGTARVFGFNPVLQGESIRRKTSVLTETPSLYERLSARDNKDLHWQGLSFITPHCCFWTNLHPVSTRKPHCRSTVLSQIWQIKTDRPLYWPHTT